MAYLILDTETGGLDHTQDALLTAYFGIIDNAGELRDQRHYKLLPQLGYRIGAEALAINNLDIATHLTAGLTLQEAKKDLIGFFEQHKGMKIIPMGWNLHFDLNFIFAQLISKPEWEKYISYHTMDVQVLARFFFNKGRLTETAKALEIDIGTAHDAEHDAKATYQIYKVIEERFKP